MSIFHAYPMNEKCLILEMYMSYTYHMNKMPRKV